VAVGVLEVHAATAVVVVDLTGSLVERIGPVARPVVPDPGERCIEEVVVDQERVVLRLDRGPANLEELQGDAAVELDRQERSPRLLHRNTEDPGQERRRRMRVRARTMAPWAVTSGCTATAPASS
jgi:hypothetical protein